MQREFLKAITRMFLLLGRNPDEKLCSEWALYLSQRITADELAAAIEKLLLSDSDPYRITAATLLITCVVHMSDISLVGILYAALWLLYYWLAAWRAAPTP